MTDLKEQLIRHEGLRLKPYRDSVGKLTIGVGRNLDDVGITHAEALSMLDLDIDRAYAALVDRFPWVASLDKARRDVLTNMTFNMGVERLSGFQKTLEAVRTGDYEAAADEMLDSTWAKQVGARAVELANIMRGEEHPISEGYGG